VESNGALAFPPQCPMHTINGTMTRQQSTSSVTSYHSAVVAGPHSESSSTLRSSSPDNGTASESREVVVRVTRLTVNADKDASDSQFHASVKAKLTAFDARGTVVGW
jgi:hypothetical protein